MATSVLANDVTLDSADVVAENEIEKAIREDPQLNDIINKLDNVSMLPDHDLKFDEESWNADSDSLSTTSSSKENEEQNKSLDSASAKSSPELVKKNGTASATDIHGHSSSSASPSNGTAHKSSISARSSSSKSSVVSQGSATSDSKKSDSGSTKSKSSFRNPLKALKKLTKFDKDEKKRRASFNSQFTSVVVDKLPQVFVVKYMGHRDVSGIFGLHHVRRPVDEMVKEVKQSMESQPEVELPLLYVVVSHKGLDLREHKRNKIKDAFPHGLIPIDFISYGVQDIKFWRVFTCIVVQELSSRSRTATCHAFLCDSSHSGRKMALSLGAAFNVYSKRLKSDGKSHNFQVELRPPDELANAVEAECEA